MDFFMKKINFFLKKIQNKRTHIFKQKRNLFSDGMHIFERKRNNYSLYN
jgi:hypothetical protein